MKNTGLFFAIGISGIIITVILQISLTLSFPGEKFQLICLAFYTLWTILLAIGVWRLLKEPNSW